MLKKHLNWKFQASELCSKLRRSNVALSRIHHYVSPKILLDIYHAIFSSHLRYKCQFWAQHSDTTSQRAFILQNFALRIIFFSVPRTPSAPLFDNFKILTEFDLKLLVTLFIHKYLNFNLPSDLCDTFNFACIDHNYATRNRTMDLLKIPLVRTTTYGFKNFLLSSRFSVEFSSALKFWHITCWNVFSKS